MTRTYIFCQRSAFTLVEIAIVLVILGFLAGGVIVGQSLIRAAELRAVVKEYEQYKIAVNVFKDRFFALPGDMTNATDFWGSAGGGGDIGDGCETATGTGTQTCNGDGNYEMGSITGSTYTEVFTFWQHLGNSGLIDGIYTGRGDVADPGVNVPESAYSNASWKLITSLSPGLPILGYNADFFEGDYTHWPLMLNAGEGSIGGPIMTPVDAWGVDRKIDDGKPGIGEVRVEKQLSDCTDGSLLLEAAEAVYLDTKTIACNLIFINKGFR